MELRSFRDLPLPSWLKLPLIIGIGGGIIVFLVSLLSPVSFLVALWRGFLAILIIFVEFFIVIYLFSRYKIDSILFGRELKVDFRSFSSISDFAWIYRVKKEQEEPLSSEEKGVSFEKLLEKTSEFGKSVEELAELAKKKPDAVAKVLRLMIEEGQ